MNVRVIGGLSEDVCRKAVQAFHIKVNVLRLYMPVSDEAWTAEVPSPRSTCWTSKTDTVAALNAALNFVDGYQVFHITGDYNEQCGSLAKAKRLLNWAPLSRPA